MNYWIVVIWYVCCSITNFWKLWVHCVLYKFRVNCLVALFSLTWYLNSTFIYFPDLALPLLFNINIPHHSLFYPFNAPPTKWMLCRFWGPVPWIIHYPSWNNKSHTNSFIHNMKTINHHSWLMRRGCELDHIWPHKTNSLMVSHNPVIQSIKL